MTLMTSGYLPNIDIIPELGMEDASYFHYFISVLRWIFELGRIDINVESSMFSLYLVIPQEENFQEILHVFAYIKKHMNTEMVFDPSEPDIHMNFFHFQDWRYSIYFLPGEEIREAIPPNMYQSLGNGFMIC